MQQSNEVPGSTEKTLRAPAWALPPLPLLGPSLIGAGIY